MDPTLTGRFIAELRREKGWSQKELAERLTVTDKAVSRWETGKGFPDTSLLKPLGDALGVSVGELLSGGRLTGGENEMKEQTDRIILDSLRYSGRMLPGVLIIVMFAVGAAMLLSPLTLAGSGGGALMIAGGVLVAVAALMLLLKKSGRRPALQEKGAYALGMALQLAALVLEILPLGAVLVFASGPEERLAKTFSFFDPTLLGNASFTPMLTGALTAAVLCIGAVALLRFDRSAKLRNAGFICDICAVLLSFMPLVLFGRRYMNAAGWAVTVLLILSTCMQAVANRRG